MCRRFRLGLRDERRRERELGDSIDALKSAIGTANVGRQEGPGDLPSPLEIRELLRLFAMLPNEAARGTVLALLRTIVGSP